MRFDLKFTVSDNRFMFVVNYRDKFQLIHKSQKLQNRVENIIYSHNIRLQQQKSVN